eukprot:3713503-Prymnesium_polylepis.1
MVPKWLPRYLDRIMIDENGRHRGASNRHGVRRAAPGHAARGLAAKAKTRRRVRARLGSGRRHTVAHRHRDPA